MLGCPNGCLGPLRETRLPRNVDPGRRKCVPQMGGLRGAVVGAVVGKGAHV